MTTLTVVRGAARLLITAGILLLLCSVLSAETITGTVNNGTTGKAASRDDVVLIRLGQGMEEAARTRTDASGHFRFHPPDAGRTLFVRFTRA